MAKTLLALLLLAVPAQDEPAELKWNSTKDDKFQLKWTFEETSRSEIGTGRKTETIDRRTVEADLTALEAPGQYAVEMKKVSWTQISGDQDITVTFQAGKKPVSAVKIKPDPKNPVDPAAARKAADRIAEHMKKLVSEGAHKLEYEPQLKSTRFSRDGAVGRNSLILDRVFLHTVLPNGTVNNNQTWKEELDRAGLPTEVEVKTVAQKVFYSGPNVLVKTGFQQPINVAGADVTGSFSLSREFGFSRENYLSSSKEEILYNRKSDPKGKDAFYTSNLTTSLKQSLTIKRIPPPEEKDKKPVGEKKPAEGKQP